MSQQQESPIVKNPSISTPEQKQADTVLSQENSQNSSTKTTVKAEFEGYKGVVESCNRIGESVTCDVLITSTIKDSRVNFYAQYSSRFSRIIDSNGDEYRASLIKYGGEEGNRYLRVGFAQGVQERIKVRFLKVPLQVNKVAVVEVNASRFKIKFEDFVISKINGNSATIPYKGIATFTKPAFRQTLFL